MNSKSTLPLSGVKVIDLSRLLPGPYCSMILADLGADVLKIEDTMGGDYVRWLPPLVKNYSGAFLALNRNKKSMKLNLKNPKGIEIFKRLIREYDVLLESFRPGVMDRLGVGYKALKEINPALIYCAISGYGQEGPYRDKAGHDINYISIAGILGITGRRGSAPAIPGAQIADIGGGSLFATIGILAALYRRKESGMGQFIDTSMMDGSLAFLTVIFGRYFADNIIPAKEENELNGGFVCYNAYETSDGKFVSLGALEPKFWEGFCRAVGREDLIDEQITSGDKKERIINEVKEIFKSKSRDEWIEYFEDKDVCIQPVLDLSEVIENQQVKHRGLFFEIDHPTEGLIKQVRTPIKMSGIESYREDPPPGYGEHSEEVLTKIGYSKDEIEEFKKEGVI